MNNIQIRSEGIEWAIYNDRVFFKLCACDVFAKRFTALIALDFPELFGPTKTLTFARLNVCALNARKFRKLSFLST